MCGGGGTTVVEAPQPSQAELDIQNLQLEQLQKQTSLYESLYPAYGEMLQQQLGLGQQALGLDQATLDYMKSTQDSQQAYQTQQLELEKTAQRLNKQIIEGQLSMQEAQQEYQNKQLQLAQEAQQSLSDYLNQEPSAYQKRLEEVGLLQADRIEKALKGELPVSSATTQAYQEDKKQMAESLSRRLGSGWETSTPGIQSMNDLEQKWEVIKDQERRGEIASGMGSLYQGIGLSSALGGQNYNQLMGLSSYSPTGLLSSNYNTQGLYANPYTGMSGISGGYSGLAGQYSSALQPYQYYSGLMNQANIVNAQSSAQAQSGLFGGLGSMFGTIGGIAMNKWM